MEVAVELLDLLYIAQFAPPVEPWESLSWHGILQWCPAGEPCPQASARCEGGSACPADR